MRRDRLTVAMMVGLPAVQLALFGYAIRTEVRHLPTVVMDESRSPSSRALVDALRNTGNFDIVARVMNRAEIRARIEAGDARAALVIPPDFETEIKRGRRPTAQVIVDAADPLASTAAINAAALAGRAAGGAGAGSVDLRIRPWYNPALKSSHYIVPGLVGLLLSITLIVMTSMAIVRERERGTLEQLVVTPIDKTSLMLGKIVPYVFTAFSAVAVTLLVGRFWFGVDINGSVVLLVALAIVFLLGSLGIGLFISTISQTQTQAMQMAMFIMLPSFLLSGFMFPREGMPWVIQQIGLLIPLTYFLQILRGIILKGVGMEVLWVQAVPLALFGLVVFALSANRFHKRLG